VAFNTLRVKKRPTSWLDLVDPAVKGKVGVASPSTPGGLSTLGTHMTMPGLGWDFYQKLKVNGWSWSRPTAASRRNWPPASSPWCRWWISWCGATRPTVSGGPHLAQGGGDPGGHALRHPQDRQERGGRKAFLRYLYSADGQKMFVKQGYVPVLPGMEGPRACRRRSWRSS